jgi:hypothetical protein
MKTVQLYLIFLIGLALFTNCCKDKVNPPEPSPELTKYEKIVGTYNVYDTIGGFLYQMNLSHSVNYISSSSIIDSVHYNGLEGQFYFSTSQGMMVNPVTYNLHIGPEGPVLDSLNKRWRIYTHYDSNGFYDNTYRNDTIRMIYRKTNILYWLEDLTPYKDTIIKIVAIKQ